MNKLTKPYGSWQSPITAEMMTSSSLSLSDPRNHNDETFWHESRPSEKGRGVVVRRDAKGKETDLFPAPYSARSGVHEYGGRCYTLSDSHLYFVNSVDQQIYQQSLMSPESEPRRVTPLDKRRYADLEWIAKGNHILAVCEDHRMEGQEPQTSIQLIDPSLDKSDGSEPQTLVEGADFYAYPRVNSDDNRLCWLEWDHPNMPWFSAELWVADIRNLVTEHAQKVAGGADEAVFQPSWHPDGNLYFCSDRNDLWNLHRFDGDSIDQVSDFDGESGLPLWQFGMQTYSFLEENTAICAVCNSGVWQIELVDLVDGVSRLLPSEMSSILHISGTKQDGGALIVAAGPNESPKILQLSQAHRLAPIKSSSSTPIPESAISTGTAVEFDTTHQMSAHGFFYAPLNPDFEGPTGETPPLVVLCHGGPTAATTNALNLKVQFWTSRGFAVFDVNYRGSTGYGRKYRALLNEKWGIYDVEDACAAATYACKQGWANPDKTIIRGSSAGGYTVLSALTFHNTFKAGGCLYGIGDLKILAQETHKFEARYGDSLIAPWPEGAKEYERRSPINHIDQLNCPVIFFQGLLDKVVPPNQAEMMVNALRRKGIAVAYETYDNEGHGFRNSETIVRSFNAELAFYGAIFNFETDSSVSDLEIGNLVQRQT